MRRYLKPFLLVQLVFALQVTPAFAKSPGTCERIIELSKSSAPLEWIVKQFIDKTLDLMALLNGLPKTLKFIEESKRTGSYLKYKNFGEMGLAEIGISVRYNQAIFESLNTGRPLIIVANHPLGIADGLTLQYLMGRARESSPSILYLARWIEKILPHAVYGDEHKWGTAIPVEINKPKESDPDYDAKLTETKAYNSAWNRTSIRILRAGGALIIFPAGHVATMEAGAGKYPDNVIDAPNSWQDSFLNLARLGKADIVFADVHSVNSEAFYKNRKRFGGGDKERIIWFLKESFAKQGKSIDVYLTKPMGLADVYKALAQTFGRSQEELDADPKLTAELMRQYTHRISELNPQVLDTIDSPQKK